MKTKIYLIIIFFFFSLHLFSQTIKKTLVAKPAITTTHAEKKLPEPEKKPTPPPTDLQKAVVNIVVGDDGKDNDTYLGILINDGTKRLAAYYGYKMNGVIEPSTTGEFFPGDNETLPTILEASEYTGEIKQVGVIPEPVLREANLSDFTNNGGSLKLAIKPNGHDTWKIKSLSLSMYFNNDSHSPRKIIWNGFTLSQDSRSKDLEFDKNFNPIQ